MSLFGRKGHDEKVRQAIRQYGPKQAELFPNGERQVSAICISYAYILSVDLARQNVKGYIRLLEMYLSSHVGVMFGNIENVVESLQFDFSELNQESAKRIVAYYLISRENPLFTVNQPDKLRYVDETIQKLFGTIEKQNADINQAMGVAALGVSPESPVYENNSISVFTFLESLGTDDKEPLDWVCTDVIRKGNDVMEFTCHKKSGEYYGKVYICILGSKANFPDIKGYSRIGAHNGGTVKF